jgi:rhodanese-related sulfurtransferase
MSSASFFISPQQLWSRIGTADAPLILDVCRREIYEAGPGVIPTAQWHKPETYAEWVPGLPTDRPIVLACRYGHNLSQMIAAELRGRGVPAQVLEGGRQAWSEAGLPVVNKAVLERFAPKSPSLWVTRRRPKIDRVACPWLIRRFIDPQARILYVDPAEWLKIGCINFGGPAGQIAMMHRMLVDEKKWIDEPRFLHALNFCMLLPGPEAQKLATYIGWLLHGVRGGLVPASCSCCPGALVMLGLSLLYALGRGVRWSTARCSASRPPCW